VAPGDTQAEIDRRIVEVLARADVPCRACGYNLRRVPQARCPECGRGVDVEDLRPIHVLTASPALLASICGMATLLAVSLVVILPLGLQLASRFGSLGLVSVVLPVAPAWMLIRWLYKPGRFLVLSRAMRTALGVTLGAVAGLVWGGILAFFVFFLTQ